MWYKQTILQAEIKRLRASLEAVERNSAAADAARDAVFRHNTANASANAIAPVVAPAPVAATPEPVQVAAAPPRQPRPAPAVIPVAASTGSVGRRRARSTDLDDDPRLDPEVQQQTAEFFNRPDPAAEDLDEETLARIHQMVDAAKSGAK